MTLVTKPTRTCLSPVCSILLLAGCVAGADDGRAAVVMSARGDAGTTQADPDAPPGFDRETARVELDCRDTVVADTLAKGFRARVRDAEDHMPPSPGMWVAIVPSEGWAETGREGGANTDVRGDVGFAYAVPPASDATTVRIEAQLRDGDAVLDSALCHVGVVTTGLDFTAPRPGSTLTHARALRLSLDFVAWPDVPAACEEGGGVMLDFVGDATGGVTRIPHASPEATLCVDIGADGQLPPLWVHAGDAGGEVRLHATAGEHSAQLVLHSIGAPAHVSLSADRHAVPTTGGTNLALRVVDDLGQAVSGVALELALLRCAAPGCPDGEAVSPATVTTGHEGRAHAAYLAGSHAGAAQVVAHVRGSPEVAASLVIQVEARSGR